MKFLLYNCDLVDNVNDPSELSNKEFQELAEKHGVVIIGTEDFEAQFNAEHFSTATHQLRIVNDDVQEKTRKIDEIQHIIQCWGATTSCELELDGSPCLSSVGSSKNNFSQLIEGFNLPDVTVVSYHNETEINSVDIPYEDLSMELIDEILEIMENYDLQKDEENQ